MMNAQHIKYITATSVKEEIVPVLLQESDGVDCGEEAQYAYATFTTGDDDDGDADGDGDASSVVTLGSHHGHDGLTNAEEVIFDENGHPMTLQQLVDSGSVEEVETVDDGDGTHTILHVRSVQDDIDEDIEEQVEEDDECEQEEEEEQDQEQELEEEEEEEEVQEHDQEQELELEEHEEHDGITTIYESDAGIYETTSELVQTDDPSVQGIGGPGRLNSFYCSSCGNCYSAAGSLKLHMRACMRQRTEVPAEDRRCHLCKKVFNSVAYLREHMLRHTGEQPYRCSRCYRKFVDEDKYKAHMEAHKHQDRLEAEAEALTAQHGGKKVVVKEFNCSFCSENFTVVFDVGQVKRRYACDACREKYSNEEALRQHKAMVEEKREFCCSRCGRKFVFEGFLQRHYPTCDGSIKRRRDIK